jgi:hypothetical protein
LPTGDSLTLRHLKPQGFFMPPLAAEIFFRFLPVYFVGLKKIHTFGRPKTNMKTTIAKRIATEMGNVNHIHLYREGLFMKAYNVSAFLFQKHVKPFRPVKKFIKSAGGEIVLIGFPSKLLNEIFPDGKCEHRGEDYALMACDGEFNKREYDMWFDAVKPTPPKPHALRRATAYRIAPSDSDATLANDCEPCDVKVTLIEKNVPPAGVNAIVAGMVEAFSVENSTPLECMMFVSKLKRELAV